jgi:hypothetical protein
MRAFHGKQGLKIMNHGNPNTNSELSCIYTYNVHTYNTVFKRSFKSPASPRFQGSSRYVSAAQGHHQVCMMIHENSCKCVVVLYSP